VAESIGDSRLRLTLAVAAAAFVCSAACSGGRPDDVRVAWNISPSPTVGGATIADIRLRDSADRAVHGARIELQGFMSHPGMAPVVTTAGEGEDGVYRGRLLLTMSGDWTVVLRASLPDGRVLTDRVDIPNVRPAGQ
jgi:hypothetical protein